MCCWKAAPLHVVPDMGGLFDKKMLHIPKQPNEKTKKKKLNKTNRIIGAIPHLCDESSVMLPLYSYTNKKSRQR